jgi:hypothetical protein
MGNAERRGRSRLKAESNYELKAESKYRLKAGR